MMSIGGQPAVREASGDEPASFEGGRDLEARLMAMMTDLAAARTAEEIVELATGEIRASLGAQSAGLWQVDEGARAATLLRCAGFPDEAALPRRIGLDERHPIAHAVASGEVWATSREEMERWGGATSCVLACLPLVVEQRAVAVLGAVFDVDRAPGAEERRFLRVLACQCALALDRARLRARARRAAEQQRRLLAVTAELSRAATIGEVARIVVDQCLSAAGARGGALWKLDAAGRRAELIRSLGYPEEALADFRQISLDDAHLPAVHAIRTGEPVWVGTLQDYRARYPELESSFRAHRNLALRAFACIPISTGERTLGALSLTFDEPWRDDEDDRAFLLLLGRHCALAFDRVESEAAQAELFAAYRRIAEAGLDRDAILAAAARGVGEVLGDLCVMRLVSEDGEPRPVASLHHRDPEARAFAAALFEAPLHDGEGLMSPVLTSGDVLRIPVIDREEVLRRISPEHRAWVERYGVHSLLVAPLRARGRVIGSIGISRDAPGRPYTAEDEALLVQVADRVALALSNAALLATEQRLNENLAFLAEASAIVASSLGVAETSERLARLVVPRLASSCVLDVVQPDGQLATLAVAHVDPDKERLLREMRRRFPPDPRLGHPMFDALRSGRVLRWEVVPPTAVDYLAEDSEHLEMARTLLGRSSILVPLSAHGAGLGVLTVTAERTFGEEDLRLFEELGRRAASALEHGLVYEAELRARRDVESVSRAKDEFLTTLSHELRTPLTAILGWTSTLRARGSDPAVAERGLAVIERNAAAQARLIEDMLNVSRIIAGKLRLERRAVDPADAVRAALDALRPTAEKKGVSVEARLAPDLGPILADPERLQQIAWNLLSNAVKFTPAGGRVEVSLARGGLAPGGEAYVDLVVRDTGIGIAAEFLPHVFDRFRQGDASLTRAYGGLGLGLSIAKHLVALHGGAISAASEGADRGATLTVSLPVGAVGEEPRPAEEEGPGDAARLAGLRVLLVDDNADTLETVAMVLREHGAEVVEAGSGALAREALERGAFDVLVSDIGMPGEDGYTLLQKARALVAQQDRELPALALTAYAGAQDASMAYRAGFQMHVGKPVSPAQIVDAVARLAGARDRPRA
jgi:signal transduction histidine kinase/ActR/RegA family two-component response regulator